MVPSTEGVLHAPIDRGRARTRVLFVLGSAAGGGAERIVAHLVKHLNRDEFDARAGLLWRHGDYLDQFAESELVVATFAQGLVPYRDQPRLRHLLPALALVPLQQREIVRRFRPHIVVTVTKSMNIAARFALPFANRRTFAWVAREGNNTGAMIDHESPTAIVRTIQDIAVRTAYRRADRVVAISGGVAAALTRRFALDPQHVSTIYNAVDLEMVRARARESLADPPREPFVVAAGRLVHQKGFDVLIKAFASRFRDRPIALVIVGEGPERSALEALARALGVERQVLLPGFAVNPWSYFARASVFVCSSRWEGFGNVIIEAMACGTPVISTDCDFGPREIIHHGDSGLLVPVDDVDALGAAMTSVFDDPRLAGRLTEHAAPRANDFDVVHMTRAYEQMFRKLAIGL